jgi:hypothetical protein
MRGKSRELRRRSNEFVVVVLEAACTSSIVRNIEGCRPEEQTALLSSHCCDRQDFETAA